MKKVLALVITALILCSISTLAAAEHDDLFAYEGYWYQNKIKTETNALTGETERILEDVKQYETGWYALLNDGTLYFIDDNMELIPFAQNVADFGSSRGTRVMLKTNGELFMWGDNTNGKIISDPSIKKVEQPVKKLDNVRDIYTGQVIYAITYDNELYGWGYNQSLGIGDDNGTDDLSEAKKLMDGVQEIIDDNFVIKEDGSLWAWGQNYRLEPPVDNTASGLIVGNRLGLGSKSAYPIAEKVLDNVKSLRSASHWRFAITENGELYGWGNAGRYFDFGVNTPDPSHPYKIIDDVVDFYDLGNYELGDCVAAIRKDGSLWCWGGVMGKEPTRVLRNAACVRANQPIALCRNGSMYVIGKAAGSLTEEEQLVVKVADNVKYLGESIGRREVIFLTEDNKLCSFNYETGEVKKFYDNIISVEFVFSYRSQKSNKSEYCCLAVDENKDLLLLNLTNGEKPIILTNGITPKEPDYYNLNIAVYFNGQAIEMDDGLPYIKNECTMMPLKAMSMIKDISVGWCLNADREMDVTKPVELCKAGLNTAGQEVCVLKIEIQAGLNYMYVNGKTVKLDCAAEAVNGNVMVPLRAIAEAMGYKVEWDNEMRSVLITD